MKEIRKHYSSQGITVIWEPAKCIHSGICARGLPEVFKPREKPWITMDSATADKIIHQVKQCPSGALAIKPKDPDDNSAEQMTGVIV